MTPEALTIVKPAEQLDIIQQFQSLSLVPTHRCKKCGSLWMQMIGGHMLLSMANLGCGGASSSRFATRNTEAP